MQQNEITESAIYHEISKFAKGRENRKTLLRLSDVERAHVWAWKKYTEIDMEPEKAKVFKYKWIARIFGFTFAIKLMERGEMNAQKEYDALKDEVPESVEIRKQEEEHEEALIQMLDEEQLVLEKIMLALRTSDGISAGFLKENCDPASLDHAFGTGSLVLAPSGKIRIPENRFFVSDGIISEIV
jgi:hypothetical protein